MLIEGLLVPALAHLVEGGDKVADNHMLLPQIKHEGIHALVSLRAQHVRGISQNRCLIMQVSVENTP